jgi:hypothetical protein
MQCCIILLIEKDRELWVCKTNYPHITFWLKMLKYCHEVVEVTPAAPGDNTLNKDGKT